MLPSKPIPAPGFKLVSGQRNPPKGIKYMVQFRNGYVDEKHTYEAEHMRWKHTGDSFDVVAVRDSADKTPAPTRPKNGSYT